MARTGKIAQLRTVSKDGATWTEHRHGSRGWHWAWSSHDGVPAKEDPQHAGIYRRDTRTEAQIHAGVGHSASHLKSALKKRDAVKAAQALLEDAPVNDPEFAIG